MQAFEWQRAASPAEAAASATQTTAEAMLTLTSRLGSQRPC